MTNYILNSILSFYNSFKVKLWPQDAVKRRRDSFDEEEDDDVLVGFRNLNKRPRWISSSFPASSTMSSEDLRSPQRSSKSHGKVINIPIKIEKRLNNEVKENGAEPEVIELDSSSASSGASQLPVEARPPLSDLSVRTKNKPAAEVKYSNGGSSSQPSPKSRIQHKKQNGVHPSLLNTFTRPLRKSSTPKQTALHETFKINESMKYSKLLADFHKSTRATSTPQSLEPSKKNFPLVNVLPTAVKPQLPVETIDLTEEDKKQKTQVKVKPWQSPSNDEEDVEIIEERPVPWVNSFEKKLSQNCVVSPQWITEMQKKYNEREREMMRQLEEAKLKKELYAKHNQSKRLEALDARIRNHLKITDVVLEDTAEESTALPELTPEMNAKIDQALRPTPSNEVLVEGFGHRITRHDVQTLNKLNWLNDEVINFYMNLLIERGKEDKNPCVYAFNTFFYPKLVSQGYASLRRWTKKVDVFAQDLLLVPVHLGMHWCLATVDFRDKMVRYYDSMGSKNDRCLNALLNYLKEESLDKKKTPYDVSEWKTENVKDIPQQMNGSDCGMFSCMFAEYLSRNAKITFSQKDMPYFRRKMVYEIITKTLLQ